MIQEQTTIYKEYSIMRIEINGPDNLEEAFASKYAKIWVGNHGGIYESKILAYQNL